MIFLFVGCAFAALTIHVVPHTHDDVGWLKTVDEYYYGANQSILDCGIQYILDSTIPILEKDPLKRFIYVEMAFFVRWWREQSVSMQNRVHALVKSGQFEFINGGWCMNDEAGTHYEATVEQMSLGHAFLKSTFGVIPTIGWQVDPFGHSSAQAQMFAHMGFDAVFFARIDYQDYARRNVSKQLEMVWRPSRALESGGQSDIFAHAMYHGTYCYAQGFAFEWADSPPIQADELLEGVNLASRADAFAQEMQNRAKNYATDQIFQAFGCDCAFQNANVNFKNMDILINYINQNKEKYGMTLQYSTPSEYLKAVHAKNRVWSVKTDDFFPYADKPHAYWTGYFTSRPALKGYVRTSAGLLHAADVAGAMLAKDAGVDALRGALSVAQHHDAVAGTERQAVADDYARRLARGSVAGEQSLALSLSMLAAKKPSSPPLKLSFCPLINETVCDPLTSLDKGSVLPIMFFNPLGWARSSYAYLPVPFGKGMLVLAPDGSPISPQVLAGAKGLNTIVFPIRVPAFGFATYFLDATNASTGGALQGVEKQDFTVENALFALDFTQGLPTRYSDVKTSMEVSQNMFYYNGSTGNNKESSQASGAYIFRPNRTAVFPITPSNVPQTTIFRGPWVSEVRQVWSDWLSQTIRVWTGMGGVDLETHVGPIPVKDKEGKEVIMRFTSEIKSKGVMYTDAQGLEMQERHLNERPTWKLKVNEPVSGNYYPKNTAAVVKDSDKAMVIVTDRSSGVASLQDGQLEVMVHRRLLVDDHRGLGQALDEDNVIFAKSRLFLGKVDEETQRVSSAELAHPLVQAFAMPVSESRPLSKFFSEHKTFFTDLQVELPTGVHIQTFRKIQGGYLVRLHHMLEKGEPVTIRLDTLFGSVKPKTLVELSLTANQPKANINRLVWTTDPPVTGTLPPSQPDNDFSIVLQPMEMRTFHIN